MHDDLCPARSASILPLGCSCNLIAKVRADERERSPIVYERDLQPLADLRAKVEAMRSHRPTELVDYQWNLAINAVLDLIDGDDSE